MMESACKPAATPLEIRGAAPPFAVGGGRMRPVSHYLGNAEPSLDEMLADEVVRRVMARDGIAPDQLRTLLETMRERMK